MLKMKKLVSASLACTMLLSAVQFSAMGAYTAPEVPEKQFSEDFEGYQILSLKDEYNAAYYAGTSVYSSVIDVAPPSDPEFYTTYADKYPNGTASVYEGNLADYGMQVPDPSGVQVNGGTKNIGQDDGWFGYYVGAGGNYNIYNRRLSVMSRNGTGEINQSQYASLNPKATADAEGKSEFNRNNVSLDGYSFTSARMNFSLDAANKSFGKAGIALTKYPSNANASAVYDAVYFTDSADSGKLDVYFNGKVVGQVALSTFSYTSTAVTSSGEWYTIQHRLYNGANSKKQKLTIIDDVAKKVIIDTEWEDIDFGESGFSFSKEYSYGIRFYAHTPTTNDGCRIRLDDIRFNNGAFTENFNSYNIATFKNSSSNDRIANGPKGNRNTSAYANGVYEGNLAKNVFVHHWLKEGTANYDTVFGGIPLWQGYVKTISNINEVRYLAATATWQYPCTVISPSERGQGKGGFDTNAVILRANAGKAKAAQAAYAGMDTVDFTDRTTLSGVVKIQQAKYGDESLALQLTEGRDTGVAGAKNYSGTSHDAYLDVFRMSNGKIYAGEAEIGSYDIEEAYRYEYTVDLTDKAAPKHALKIFNNVTNVPVAVVSETDMILSDGFDFASGINGFRIVAEAPTYVDSANGDIMAYFDDITVENIIPASISGKSTIRDAVYSAEDNKVVCTVDMAQATSEKGTFIYAVFNSDDTLVKAYTAEKTSLDANENTVEIPVEDDYRAGEHYGKVFYWDNLETLKPNTEAADSIIK